MGAAPAFPFFFILYTLLLQSGLCRNVFPAETQHFQGQTREKRAETIIEKKHINLTIFVEEDGGKGITYTENCQEVQKKLEQKINELDEKTNVNSRLALKVAELQFLLSKAQSDTKSDINVLKKQLEDTKLELQKKNTLNSELVLKVNEMQRSLLEIEKVAAEGAKAQIVALQTKLQIKISELDEKSKDNSKLYLEILVLKRQMKELESGTSANISGLKEQLQRTAEELKLREKQLEVKTGINYQLVSQILELQNEIWQLQKWDSSTTSSSQVDELLKQLEAKINQLENTPDDDSKLVVKIFALESRITDLQREYVNLTVPALISEIKMKLDRKTNELKETLKQLENRKNDNSQLLLQIVNLTKTVENLQKQDKTKTLAEQIKDLQNKIQNMDKGFVELQTSCNVIQKNLQKITSQLEEKTNDNSKLVSEIKQLKQLMKEVEKEAAERNAAKINEIQTDLQNKIQKLKEISNDNSKMVMEILSLKYDVNLLKSGSSTKIKELEQLLKEKAEQLKLKNKQLELKTNLNSELVLQILELQSIIWNLERGGTNGTVQLFSLLKELERKIEQMEDNESDDSKLVLKIFALESIIKEISKQSLNETSPGVLTEIQQKLDEKNKELEKTRKELESRSNENSKMLVKIVELQEKLVNIQGSVSNQTVLNRFAEMQDELKKLNVRYQKLLVSYNELQTHLEDSNNELKNVTDYNIELERDVRRMKNLLSKLESEALHRCSVQMAALQTELTMKINELEQNSNDNSKLILQILTLQTQINNIKSASSADVEELQRLLKEKQEQLKLKNQQLEVKTNLNSQLVQQILDLQSIIWNLERGGTSGTDQLHESLKQLEDKISEMEDKSDDDSKLVLKIFALETIIREITKQSLNQTSPSVISELEKKLAVKTKELEETLKQLKNRNNENSKLLVEIVELEKTVNNLEKQAEDQKPTAQIIELEKELENKNRQCGQLQRNYNVVQKELQETQDQLDQKTSANSKLMEKVNDLKEALSKKNYETSTQIAALQSEQQKMIGELNETLNDNSKLVLQIYTLQTQVKTLQSGSSAKIKELQKLLQEKTEQLEEKNKQLEMKTDLNSKLVVQILELQSIIFDMENGGTNGTTRLFDTLHQLEEKINQMEERPEDDTKLVLKIFALQSIIKELLKESANTTDKESYIKANEELQKKLVAKNKELAETMEKLKQKESQNSKMLVQIVELESSVRQLQDTIDNQTSVAEIVELKEQLKAMDDRYSRLQNKYNDLETKLKEKETAHDQLQARYNDLLKELEGSAGADSKAQRQLKDKEEENKRLEAKLKELQSQFTEKEEDCTRLQSRYDDLQSKLMSQNENQSKLQAAYNDLQKQVKDKENEYLRLNNKYNDIQKQLKETDDNYKILEEKYGDVQKEIEEKDDSTIKTPEIILDADTAHPRLLISEDGKKIKIASKRQDVPQNPRRFDTHFGVLGKMGFTSGKRYWEVYAGTRPCYSLGVTAESAPRKGNFRLQPKTKYWAFIKIRGDVYRALDTQVKTLNLNTLPQSIGVFLDYEGGKVSFYDPNSRSHLYTFQNIAFNEKVFPFILTCEDTDPTDSPIVMSPVSKKVSWLE